MLIIYTDEKIIDIKLDITDEISTTLYNSSYSISVEGLDIVTNYRTIQIRVDNRTECCEKWGYVTTNDDITQFIGATLVNIGFIDSDLRYSAVGASVDIEDLDKNRRNILENMLNDKLTIYEGQLMFINLNTDRGLLQFVVYNDHNGYYSHSAHVISVLNDSGETEEVYKCKL